MPGLRSLVARRRSTLASPQYLGSSKTPPPPSSSSSAFNYAQKIERRCNSLPGQVSLDAYEAPGDSQLARPYISGASFFNGLSNGTFVGVSAQRSDRDKQNNEVSTIETITSSERGGRVSGSNSSSNSVGISSNNSNSSDNISADKKKTAMEIESFLARRGVTVVRRMIDTEENSESHSKELMPFSLKDSVITANPLITKENTKSNSEETVRPSSIVPTSATSSNPSQSEEPKSSYEVAQDPCLTNPSRELYEHTHSTDMYDKVAKNIADSYRDTGQPRSHSAYEPTVCISQHSSTQPSARTCEPVVSTCTQGLSGGHPYYNQLLSHQQNVKEPVMQEGDSPSYSNEYHGSKESTSLATAQASSKRNSSEMSAPLGSSVFANRSVAQHSPQPRSNQQSKAASRVSQFPETSSPHSKSSEVSPQSKSADMSPYSRSSEPSPSSRNAQVSPHSRSSQMSPLSSRVKASPHSRSSEVSPQARGQPSPLTRSDLSPKSKSVGLSPQSTSVDSPQPRASSGSLLQQPIQQNHQPLPAVNPAPMQSVGHSQISSSERNISQSLTLSHPSQALPPSSLQQGTPQGRSTSSTNALAGFPNIPTSEYLGRSVSNMFPGCNTSEILSSQANTPGFPVQMNPGGFGMNANTGSFLGQGNSVTFPPPPSLGYNQDGSTASQFSSINVSGAMTSNANPMGFGNLPNCGGFPLHEITGLYGSHANPGVYNATEALNYVASRDFSMHSSYRDFSSYNAPNHVSSHMRSQELSAHGQRDVLSSHNSRELNLQNCNQIMSAHHSVRDPSLSSMGREGHLIQNYGEQQLQSGYSRSSLYQRSNSDISSLVDNRSSNLRQNYRETPAYKSDHLSNTYRDAHDSVRNTPTPATYRDQSVLSNTSDYQSSPSSRGSNILSGFREESVLTSYREQEVLSNFLAAAGSQVPTNYREQSSHSSNRDQIAAGYREMVNQTSPPSQPLTIPPYQDVMNPPESRSTIRSTYSETVSHNSPSETLTAQYRESVGQPSPSDRVQGYGESVNHSNTRDMLPGFHNMQSPTGTNERELPSNYRDTVSHRSPRDQVLHGYQLSSTLHSPRQQQQQQQSVVPYKENQPVPPVEQSIPSYEGNITHSSPSDQQGYPVVQKKNRESHAGYQESNYTSPRQSLPSYGEGRVAQDSSPRKPIQGYRDSIEHASPSQQLMPAYKDPMDYGNVSDSIGTCSSTESIVRRSSHEYGSGYDGSVPHTPSHEGVGTSSCGELQGLQNFRVLSQHRSPNEFSGALSETKTAVLPSFTESFENASHNKLCINESSVYKSPRESTYYGIDSEKYCGELPSERLQPYSDETANIYDNLEDGQAKNDIETFDKCQEQSTANYDKTLPFSNAENSSCIDTGKTPHTTHVKSACQEIDGSIIYSVSANEQRQSSTESTSSCASRSLIAVTSLKNHGLSPEMISNHRDQPIDCYDAERGEQQCKQTDSSPVKSKGTASSDESPEKGDQGESSGKSNVVSSPSPQERIVIKMKLLHKPPGEEGHFHNGKYGNSEAGLESGNCIRYPGVKYTRWTIDSIINGREDGGTEVLSPGTIKKEEKEDEKLSDSQCSPCDNPEKSRKRRRSESPNSKPTKFDTNKNLMKKSLKITITNPLRAARVATIENIESKSVILKSDSANTSSNQESLDSSNVSGSNSVGDDEKSGRSKQEMSLLRSVRKHQDDDDGSVTPGNKQSGLSSSSASKRKRSGRRLSEEALLLGLRYPLPKIKQCSIVIKRIYTGDNYSCYSSHLCDKGKTKDSSDSPVVGRRRPKRKAAIEANEKRHKSLRSFDRSLEMFNSINSEKVPYNGPISNKYKTLLPVIQPLPPPLPKEQELLPQKQPLQLSPKQHETLLQDQHQSSSSMHQAPPTEHDESLPSTQCQSSPATQQQSSPLTPQQSSPSTQQQSPPSTQLQSPPSTQQQLSPSTQQQLSPSTQQQSLPSTQQQSLPSTQQQSLSSEQQQSPSSTQQQSPSSTQQQSPSSTQQQSPSSTQQQSPPSTQQEPPPSTQQEPSPLTQKEPPPSQKEPLPSTQKEPLPSTWQEPPPSTWQEPPPTQQQSPPSTPQQSSPSTQQQSSPSTPQQSPPSTPQQSPLSTQQQSLLSTPQQLAPSTQQQSSPPTPQQSSPSTQQQSSPSAQQQLTPSTHESPLQQSLPSPPPPATSPHLLPSPSPLPLPPPEAQEQPQESPQPQEQPQPLPEIQPQPSPVPQSQLQPLPQSQLQPLPQSQPQLQQEKQQKQQKQKQQKQKQQKQKQQKQKQQNQLPEVVLISPVKQFVNKPSRSGNQNILPKCSVLVCDIFMNRRINNMSCPGCSRNYDSSDSVRVNLSKMEMSLMCCKCRWEVIKNVKSHEVEAMEPR